MMGYRPKITTASEVELEVTQQVDPISGGYTPNFDQALFISGGAIVGSTDNNDTTFVIDSSDKNNTPTGAVIGTNTQLGIGFFIILIVLILLYNMFIFLCCGTTIFRY